METNPIYDFLKNNNLTSKDESSFLSEYSSPEKAKELHGFFVNNNLTTKGFDDFYGEYFKVKKKDFQGFSQELPKPTMPSGEKFTQGIGLGVKPISSTVSPSASKPPKSTIPSASTGVKEPKKEIIEPKDSLGSYNPVARVKLYNQAIGNIQNRIPQLVQQFNEAQLAGDENAMQELKGLIDADTKKLDYFNKAIQGQKQLAAQQQPSTLGNAMANGLEMAAGTIMSGVNFVDEFIASLSPFQLSEKALKEIKELDEKALIKRPSDIIAKGGKEILKEAKKSSEETMMNMPYGGGVYDALKKGDLKSATSNAAYAFTTSLPTSLLMVNPITGSLAASGMAQESVDEKREEKGFATTDDYIVGSLKASTEYIFENMFGTGKQLKQLVSSLGKEVASETIEKTVKAGLKEYAKKLGLNIAEESFGEGLTQITQNAIDKADGKDIGLFDNVPDAALIGLFGGITQGGVTTTISHYVDRVKLKEAEAAKAKATELAEQALNAPSQVVADAIEREAEKLNDLADEIIEKNNEIGANAPVEITSQIEENNNKIDELEASISEATPEISEIITSQLKELELKNAELIKNAEKLALEKLGKTDESGISQEAAPKGDTGVEVTEPVIEEGKEQVEIEETPIKEQETIAEASDSKGVYLKDGEYGVLRTDGQTVVFETNDKIFDLGNKDELSDVSIAEFGIEKEEPLNIQVNQDNSIVIDDVRFVNNFSEPQAAINTDADGNVISVNLETEDGKKRTFRGQRAEEIAYQYKLKEFEQNATEESIARLEQEVTSIEGKAEKAKSETKKRSAAKRKSETIKTKEDAVQKQTAGQVPVQPEAKAGEGVEGGKPEAESKEATEESKVEEIGTGLLNFLGIPSEVESKDTGVNVSNKSALSELESKVKGDKKSIIEAAKKAIATLKSVFPDMEIYIHETPESYNKVMRDEVGGVENSRGNFAFERDANNNPTGRGRIDINLSNAKDTTVAHELTHAVLLKTFGDNPALFKTFRDRISNILRADLNEQVTAFEKLYAGQDVAPEEYLTELAALLSQGGEKVKYKPSTLRRIASLINEFVSRITKGKLQPFKSEADFKNFVDFLNQVATAISEGGAIEGVTEKINTSAKPTGIKVDTSSLKSKASLIQDLGLERFNDMGKRITQGITIKDLGDIESHLTFSDRLVTGKVGGKNYLGGILFAAATNRVWASFTKTRVSQIISGMPKNKDGYRYLMPALLTDIAHMSNKDMSNTAIRLVEDAISKGEISPLEANERITKALSRKGLEKFFELYSNTIGKNKITPKIIISAIDNALVKSNTTFDDRNTFLETLLGKADIDLKKRFGTLPSYNVLANGLAEPITSGHDFGDILLVIRTKGDLIAVQPKEGDADYHPSYPWVIRSVNPDGSIAEVETLIFKESYNAIDVFPEVTNKQGQKFTYQQYVEKYGIGAKSRYLGYMGARSTMSTSVTEKIASEAKSKATIVSKSQRVDKASDKLKELFQRDNIPLTIAEAKAIVKEVYDWTSWYDGLAAYVSDIFGEYSEDILSMLPLASMAANSSATVGLAINNAEKIYRGEKPSGVAEYYGYVTDFLEGKGIKSDKMSEFFKALTGNKDAIAVDMHVYSIIMGKNPNKKQVNPSNKQEFDKAKEFVRTLASELDLAPREVQAALWAANILRTGGRPDSYEQYFKKQIDEKRLKERIENWRNEGYKPFSEIRKNAEASAKKEGATIKSKAQKVQDEKIKEYIDSQRKAGQTDKNIRAGIEMVADRLGLSILDIDNLMNAEKIENSKKAFEFWLNLGANNNKFVVSTKMKSEAAKAGIDEKALKNAAKTMKNIDEIRKKLLDAKVIETIDCKWG